MAVFKGSCRFWLAVLLITAQGYGADVRGFSWGDARAVVLKKEAAPRAPESYQRAPFQTEDGVSFFASSLGRPAMLTYHFNAGMLSRAVFEFTTIHHYVASEYLTDYAAMKKELTKELGDGDEWDIWSDGRDHEGLDRSWAIGERRLKVVTTWQFPDATVELILAAHPYFAATPRIWLVSTSTKFYPSDPLPGAADTAPQPATPDSGKDTPSPAGAEQTAVPPVAPSATIPDDSPQPQAPTWTTSFRNEQYLSPLEITTAMQVAVKQAHHIRLINKQALWASAAASAILTASSMTSQTVPARSSALSQKGSLRRVPPKRSSKQTIRKTTSVNVEVIAKLERVDLYMPDAWISYRNTTVRRQYKNYSPNDYDRLKALTVVAGGGVYGTNAVPTCASVDRVILTSDKAGTLVTEAVSPGLE